MSRKLPKCPVCGLKRDWMIRKISPNFSSRQNVFLAYRIKDKSKYPSSQWQIHMCCCGGSLLIEWRPSGRAKFQPLAFIDLNEGNVGCFLHQE